MTRLVAVIAALTVAGCGPSDQQALEDVVARRLGNPQGLEVSEALIYREGDIKKACLTASFRNNWGEPVAPQRFIAWYVFATESWHTDNPQPIDDGLNCEQYAASRGQIL